MDTEADAVSGGANDPFGQIELIDSPLGGEGKRNVEFWLPVSGWNRKFQAVGTEAGQASSVIPPWRTPFEKVMPAPRYSPNGS